MKITIDTDICKKKGKDVDLVLYLISLLSGSKITVNTFEKARQQGLIKFEQMYDRRFPFPETVSISDTGAYIIEGVLADSTIRNITNEHYLELANKLREIFPAGKKPGYAYTWRDSTDCIVDRLKKFTLRYGEYSDEEIIDATKRYVNSFNGDYQYMQLLKYFIWKNKVTGGETERQSQLAAYLEDDEEVMKINHDWDVTLC